MTSSPARRLTFLVALLLVLPALPVGGPVGPVELAAQARDSVPGVRLGLIRENAQRPALALKPFTGRFGGQAMAGEVERIVARDLDFSDRFEVMDSLPPELLPSGVDYQLWDQLGAVWLVTAQVEGAADDFVLLVEVHDIVYGEVTASGRFELPPLDDDGFRMAVHRVSDEIVDWITGEPGMAASRIAFSMPDPENPGNQELWVIDSDGENLTRLTDHETLTQQPAWHPSGTRMAYVSYRPNGARVFELDLVNGQEIEIEPGREGQYMTPSYFPDGNRLAFAVVAGNRSGIFAYDLARNCCLENLTGGRWNDLSPTFSPDGRLMAFNSNRLGTRVPQIYVSDAGGGEADLVTPYRYGNGGYFTSPDWDPTSRRVALHGRVERGTYQILVAEVEARGSRLLQLTWEGNNEDPTWAPDGRHIAFVGERSWGFGLFIVDTVSGRIRPLVTGRRIKVPDWSPSLRENAWRTLRNAPF